MPSLHYIRVDVIYRLPMKYLIYKVFFTFQKLSHSFTGKDSSTMKNSKNPIEIYLKHDTKTKKIGENFEMYVLNCKQRDLCSCHNTINLIGGKILHRGITEFL